MKRYLYNGAPLSESEAFKGASEAELRVLCLLLSADSSLSAEELYEGASI